MADNVTNELILENLRQLQATVAAIRAKQDDIGADLRDVKGHMALFLQSELRKEHTIAAFEARIDRIERRLDLLG